MVKSANKILIVEDDAWFAEYEQTTLKHAGYDAVISPHVFDAVEQIDRVKPVLLIVDLLLAGNTGLVLLNELQTYTDTQHIPVVICSNLSAQLKLDDLKHYGVVQLLDKTAMTPQDLVAVVKRVLS